MLSFTLFVVILVFLTIFYVHTSQTRRLAMLGVKTLSQFPAFLVKKVSDGLYIALSMGFMWILVIIGGIIANANSSAVLKSYPGITWAIVYFVVLAIAYAALWYLNKKRSKIPDA